MLSTIAIVSLHVSITWVVYHWLIEEAINAGRKIDDQFKQDALKAANLWIWFLIKNKANQLRQLGIDFALLLEELEDDREESADNYNRAA